MGVLGLSFNIRQRSAEDPGAGRHSSKRTRLGNQRVERASARKERELVRHVERKGMYAASVALRVASGADSRAGTVFVFTL